MKKVQRLLVVLLAIMVVTLGACGNNRNYDGEAYVLLSVSLSDGGFEISASSVDSEGRRTDYSTRVEGEGFLIDAILLLTDEGLHFAADSEAWGTWLKEIGSIVPSAANEYVASYNTSTDLQYSTLENSVEVDGEMYYYSALGVDDMPLMAGVGYIFVVDTF